VVCVPRPADPEELERKAGELLGARRGSGSGELASGGRLAGLRVLAVDDQAVNRMVIAGQLRRFGIEPTLAGGGAEAVRLAIDGTAWDLVLMDCQMPEVDGFTAVERIRAGGGRMPIVAVTAHAMAGDREECLRRGFDGYLPKPIRPDELAAVLAAHAPAAPAETAAAPAAAPPTDPFAALRAEIGQEVLAEVLRAMLAETPAQVAEACRAAQTGDLATAAKRAHAVKGNAGNILLADLAEAAKAIEAAARGQDAAAAAAAAPALAAAWRTAEAVIRAALV
jgi:CheY-like chemotaxis protein/HPt (histidine-containing phosphotransfer) domain-containing protein